MATPKKPHVRETVSLYEAKTHLSELVEKAAQGAEIVISKSGKPKALLVPLPPRPERRPGRGKGTWGLQPGWDDPLPGDITAMIEDPKIFPDAQE